MADLPVKKRRADTCARGAKNPVDQIPAEEATGIQSTMALRKMLKRCPGHKEYWALQGQDPKTKMSLTVLAMVFTHKLCTAICVDIETLCNEKKINLQTEEFPYFEIKGNANPSECKKCKYGGEHVHTKDAGCKLYKKPSTDNPVPVLVPALLSPEVALEGFDWVFLEPPPGLELPDSNSSCILGRTCFLEFCSS